MAEETKLTEGVTRKALTGAFKEGDKIVVALGVLAESLNDRLELGLTLQEIGAAGFILFWLARRLKTYLGD